MVGIDDAGAVMVYYGCVSNMHSEVRNDQSVPGSLCQQGAHTQAAFTSNTEMYWSSSSVLQCAESKLCQDKLAICEQTCCSRHTLACRGLAVPRP
eukprot:1133621-Pelagomonas_calceolata.AAC.2